MTYLLGPADARGPSRVVLSSAAPLTSSATDGEGEIVEREAGFATEGQALCVAHDGG
jgi:hypothetical protein